jgi:peptidoglycan/LPS O-acetylase OafA/YrhL
MVPGLALAAPLVWAPLIASLPGDCGPVARLFQDRVFQYLGRASYSLYLGHATIAPLLAVVLKFATNGPERSAPLFGFLAAALLIGHCLYRFVETPWRERFNAWSETLTRPRDDSSSSAQTT